jgi:hypothetical protein
MTGTRRARWQTLAAIAALGFGTACRGAPSHDAQPTPSASAAAARDVPALSVDGAHYAFDDVVQGGVLHHTFELANTGRFRVDLEEVTEALGCVGVPDPLSLEPGGKGKLDVTCHVEFYGPLHVTLALRSKADSATLALVDLTGNVTPLLAFDTPLVDLRLPFGEERTADVRLRGVLAGEVKLSWRDAGDAGFTIASLPATGSAPQGLRLTVKGRTVGTHVGNIVAKTNLARPRELSLPYSCEVVGTLEVNPSTPYFDFRVPGAQVREVIVHSTQPGFAVRAVGIVDGPFTASFAPGAVAGEYRVTVTARTERISGDARGTLGRLVISSNDRTEPKKELPLFAFGAPNSGASAGSDAHE